MGVDDENHGKSSHGINVFYPLHCHYACKDTEKSRNAWLFEYKNVSLHHERAYYLD